MGSKGAVFHVERFDFGCGEGPRQDFGFVEWGFTWGVLEVVLGWRVK